MDKYWPMMTTGHKFKFFKISRQKKIKAKIFFLNLQINLKLGHSTYKTKESSTVNQLLF